jgi:hypothetical protein
MCLRASHRNMRALAALGLASLVGALPGCYEGAVGLPSAKDATMSAIQPPEVDPVEYDPPVLVMPIPDPVMGPFEWVLEGLDLVGEGSLIPDMSGEGSQSLNLPPGS